jgi:RNA polymerase sigma-70 factor, ECF subfamily
VRAAAGESSAFDVLVLRHRDRVFRLCRRFFRRPEDAEEAAQETFLKVYQALARYRESAPFDHWLLRIATNTCRDLLRHRRRRPEAVLADITDAPAEWLDAALRGASLEQVEAEHARALAARLLDTLPPKDRIVLVLMDLEGMTAAEVANVTGSTRGAVKVRAMRARRALGKLAERVERRAR